MFVYVVEQVGPNTGTPGVGGGREIANFQRLAGRDERSESADTRAPACQMKSRTRQRECLLYPVQFCRCGYRRKKVVAARGCLRPNRSGRPLVFGRASDHHSHRLGPGRPGRGLVDGVQRADVAVIAWVHHGRSSPSKSRKRGLVGSGSAARDTSRLAATDGSPAAFARPIDVPNTPG
jgi:hypothetical protein